MYQQLLETDQIHCYAEDGRSINCENSGQDATQGKKSLFHSRFEASDHLVRDNLTGAIWTRDANLSEFPLTWNEALSFVDDMRARQAHGHAHWQLPSRQFLFSLLSHQNINPTLPNNHLFDNVFPGYYWTCDSCRRLPDQAWYVHLGGGRVHRGMKHGSYMVWPMSPGPQKAVNPDREEKARFKADDACVHDAYTGLAWSIDANPAKHLFSWQEALSATHDFNHKKLGGFKDWRLPNIRELESIVDLRSHSPAFPAGHPFINVQEAYWSSTTSVYEPRYAWTLYCRDGIVGVGFKPQKEFYTWPVRGGWQ